MAFVRYKREAENALLASGFPASTCFGPHRARNRISATGCCEDLHGVSVLFPNRVIVADDLARAVMEVAVGETRETEAWLSRTVTSAR
jgi:hypothetical protein